MYILSVEVNIYLKKGLTFCIILKFGLTFFIILKSLNLVLFLSKFFILLIRMKFLIVYDFYWYVLD